METFEKKYDKALNEVLNNGSDENNNNIINKKNNNNKNIKDEEVGEEKHKEIL